MEGRGESGTNQREHRGREGINRRERRGRGGRSKTRPTSRPPRHDDGEGEAGAPGGRGTTMNVQGARDVARAWVRDEAEGLPGFAGAYFAGSTNGLPDDATLPVTSDLDVMIVVDGAEPANKIGKFRYRDVLIEASYVALDRLRTPEMVLGDYHLAGGFRTPSVIVDPTGNLGALQAVVGREFARRRWVRARCEQARAKVVSGYRLDEAATFPERVMAWIFPAGITTHVVLVAGLRNPTVRRRYVAVRELLAEYGRTELYEPLLGLLGCAGMGLAEVERHLDALAEVFDVAAAVIQTRFPFAADISAAGRPVAIDGSRELIAGGPHREAVFWIAVTWSRCQMVLERDGSMEMAKRAEAGYRRLLGALGIVSVDDLWRRRLQVEDMLPRVWGTAEAIMTANPKIVD